MPSKVPNEKGPTITLALKPLLQNVPAFQLNGDPSAVLAVYQLPGTNAVQTVAGVRKLLARMKRSFPEGPFFEISSLRKSLTRGGRGPS